MGYSHSSYPVRKLQTCPALAWQPTLTCVFLSYSFLLFLLTGAYGAGFVMRKAHAGPTLISIVVNGLGFWRRSQRVRRDTTGISSDATGWNSTRTYCGSRKSKRSRDVPDPEREKSGIGRATVPGRSSLEGTTQ